MIEEMVLKRSGAPLLSLSLTLYNLVFLNSSTCSTESWVENPRLGPSVPTSLSGSGGLLSLVAEQRGAWTRK